MRRDSLLLAVALAACSSPEVLPEPAAVRAPAWGWAGQPIVLESDGFINADAIVRVNGSRVETQRVDPMRLSVVVPIAGRTVISVSGPGVITAEMVIDLYGFAGHTELDLQVYDGMLPWPAPPFATGFLVATSSGLFEVDGATGRVEQRGNETRAANGCARGVGPSYLPDAFVGVGRPFCLPARVLRGRPIAAQDSAMISSGRYIAQLGPGRWLTSYHHNIMGVGPGGRVDVRQEETRSIKLSPRGDRAVATFNVHGGAPVWDMNTATVAYTVPAFGELDVAAFTPGGDRMFLIGVERYGIYQSGTHLMSIDPGTGAVLADRPFPYDSTFPSDAEVTADGRYLVVLVTVGDPVTQLWIFDTATLEQVAAVPAPAALALYGAPRLAISRNQVYAIGAPVYNGDYRGRLLRFTLPANLDP